MRINNNLMAANTTRMLGVNQANSSKSMEKLSSGLRINKGGDDAAGLAISEKMRGQIRGLNQASKNSQDGISLLQTADGAMNQQHAILQRMRELAVQASTGTLQDADRGQIDKEFQQLSTEVGDIAQKTQFNKMDLMSGTFGARVSATAGSIQVESFNLTTGAHSGGLAGVSGIQLNGTSAGTYTFTDDGTDMTVTKFDGTNTQTVSLTGTTMTAGAQTLSIKEFGISITTKGVGIQSDGTTAVPGFAAAGLNGQTLRVDGSAVNVQTGANENETMGITIRDMGTSATGLNLDGANTLTATAASNAITTVESSIKIVSDERAKLGALSNRLEYKMNSIDSTSENLQSAESKIRDVDMAKEMVNYSKNDILNQAAQAMLAKANQAPQNILQLLR